MGARPYPGRNRVEPGNSSDEAPFIHLSTLEQVRLPANRPSAAVGLVLLVDPASWTRRCWEPGVPTDPASMLFPHLYRPCPVSAVFKVTAYRPGPDGTSRRSQNHPTPPPDPSAPSPPPPPPRSNPDLREPPAGPPPPRIAGEPIWVCGSGIERSGTATTGRPPQRARSWS